MVTSKLIAEIRKYGFEDTPEGTLLDFLNAAKHDIESAGDFPYLSAQSTATVSAGGTETSLAGISTLSKVRAVICGGKRLIPLEIEDFITRSTSSGPSGTVPTHYTISGAGSGNLKILVYPAWTAGGTLDVWYRRLPADLTVSPDLTPELPPQYHYALVYGALSHAFAAEDGDQADYYQKLFDDRVSKAADDLSSVNIDRTDAPTGTYTLWDMAQEVRDEGQVQLDNGSVFGLLNDTMFEIISETEFKFAQRGPVDITFTAGSSTVTLPTDVAKVIGIVTANRSLEAEYLDNLLDRRGANVFTDTGAPQFYCVDGVGAAGQPALRLYPTPTQTETAHLLYYAEPARMTSYDAVPPWPKRHHRILVCGAIAKALRGDKENPDAWKVFQQEYDDKLARMKFDLAVTQTDSTRDILLGDGAY